MWPISLALWKKQNAAEVEPAPMSTKQDAAEIDPEPVSKVCRVCWRGDEEDGEEKWVAPCRCPRTTAWVHRRCLAWRLKHTPNVEDKLRCAVCKWVDVSDVRPSPPALHICPTHSFRYAYKKRLRLKSIREWFDGWKRDWFSWLHLIAIWTASYFSTNLNLKLSMRGNPSVAMFFFKLLFFVLCSSIAVALALGALTAVLHIYAAFPMPETNWLALYKRFLAVAARDWLLDAPPPPRDPFSTTS